MKADGIEGLRVPTRHHASVMLVPSDTRNADLDRWLVAQIAREALRDELERRQRAVRKGRLHRPR